MTTYFITCAANKYQSEVISLEEVRLLNEQKVAYQTKSKYGHNSDHPGILVNGHSGKKVVISETVVCNGKLIPHRDREQEKPCSAEIERNHVTVLNEKSENLTEIAKPEKKVSAIPETHVAESSNREVKVIESQKSDVKETESVQNEPAVAESHASVHKVTETQTNVKNVTETGKREDNQSHTSDKSASEPQKGHAGSSESQDSSNSSVNKNVTEKESEGDHIVTGSQRNSQVTVICSSEQNDQADSDSQTVTVTCGGRKGSLENGTENKMSETKRDSVKSGDDIKTSVAKCDKNGIIPKGTSATPCYKTKISCNGLGKSKYDEFCEKSDEHEHMLVGDCDVVMRKSLKSKKNVIDQNT